MANKSLTIDFSIIRTLRKKNSMTLEEVSKSSGISAATLSKLERNQHMVEIETLYRLARVFGLSASDLLNLVESCSAHVKDSEKYKSGPFEFEKIHFKGIDCFHATAKTGSRLNKPEAHGDEYEICWVHKGKVAITLPMELHTLKAGQALKFDAVLEHSYNILEDSELSIVHLEKTHRF
ncbi:MAG: XRE family transcriptional regulator [Verrucomicrobiota bacterium]